MLAAGLHRRTRRSSPCATATRGARMLAQSLTAHAPWRAIPTQIAGIKHAHAPTATAVALGLTYPGLRRALRPRHRGADPDHHHGQGGRLHRRADPGRGRLHRAAAGVLPDRGGDRAASTAGVFICDEVQTGFGRTGGTMFGIEHWGVEPEIMTMAKGIANGLPHGRHHRHRRVAAASQALTISTFGGNPVCCTAAQATIEVIEQRGHSQAQRRAGRRVCATAWRRWPESTQLHRRRARHGADAGHRAGGGPARPRSPPPARAVALMEETRQRGAAHRQGRALRQRAAHRPADADHRRPIWTAGWSCWAGRWRSARLSGGGRR